MSTWRKKNSDVDANNHGYEMESNNYGTNNTSDIQNGNVVKDTVRASVQGLEEPSYESLEETGLNKEVKLPVRDPSCDSYYEVNDCQMNS